MKDCFFYVADKNIEAIIRGLFSRNNIFNVLGIRNIDVDLDKDLKVASGLNDPGIYSKGHHILKALSRSYEHVFIILDSTWEGSPGAIRIADKIIRNMISVGWRKNRIQVIVVDPEIENWIWQDNINVARALNFKPESKMRKWLEDNNLWPKENVKPPDPKKAVEEILKNNGLPRSSSIYQEIASKVSFRRCQDESFRVFVKTLKNWFPA